MIKFIHEVEQAHFRTEHDSGANLNAMMIWNIVRNKAGLPPLAKKDLRAWCDRCSKYHVSPCQ